MSIKYKLLIAFSVTVMLATAVAVYGIHVVSNASTLVVCMIETPEGVNNVEEIAKVDGVDVIHIGANDLLTAMGKPGAFGDPEGAKAIDRVISVTAANGKIPGMDGDRHIPRQIEYIRKGARFITTNSEIAFIMAEGTRVTTELRPALAEK